MRINLLPSERTCYKASLHCHTNLSDGLHTPEEIKRAYIDRGYSIVAFTDHFTMYRHPELEDSSFIPINSYEIAFSGYETGYDRQVVYRNKACHLNAYAIDPNMQEQLPSNFCTYDAKQINAHIRELHEKGFLVSLNHPEWGRQFEDDFLELEGYDFLEVYNSAVEYLENLNDAREHYHQLLRNGRKINVIAADDAHQGLHTVVAKRVDLNSVRKHGLGLNETASDLGRAFTMIYPEKFEYRSVMTALKNGEFYCSSGPIIKALYLEDGRFCIDCTPARCIMLTGNAFCRDSVYIDMDANVVHAEFPLDQIEMREDRRKLFTVKIVDATGHIAYSNPFDLDELEALK